MRLERSVAFAVLAGGVWLSLAACQSVVPGTAGTAAGPASTAHPGPLALRKVLTTVPAGTSSAALDCAAEDPLRGKDDLDQPLVACGLDKSTKYVLAPAFLTGREVAGATAIPLPERGGYGVGVTLTDDGARVFGDFTMQNVNSQVAITVDTTVVSAPLITSAIPGGDVQISGDFTKAEAEDLANKISRR